MQIVDVLACASFRWKNWRQKRAGHIKEETEINLIPDIGWHSKANEKKEIEL